MANQRDAASRFNLNVVNLEPLTADPTEVIDGDVWYRKDLEQFRVAANGGTKYAITVTAV